MPGTARSSLVLVERDASSFWLDRCRVLTNVQDSLTFWVSQQREKERNQRGVNMARKESEREVHQYVVARTLSSVLSPRKSDGILSENNR